MVAAGGLSDRRCGRGATLRDISFAKFNEHGPYHNGLMLTSFLWEGGLGLGVLLGLSLDTIEKIYIYISTPEFLSFFHFPFSEKKKKNVEHKCGIIY